MMREPGNRVLFPLPFGLDLEVNMLDFTYLYLFTSNYDNVVIDVSEIKRSEILSCPVNSYVLRG